MPLGSAPVEGRQPRSGCPSARIIPKWNIHRCWGHGRAVQGAALPGGDSSGSATVLQVMNSAPGGPQNSSRHDRKSPAQTRCDFQSHPLATGWTSMDTELHGQCPQIRTAHCTFHSQLEGMRIRGVYWALCTQSILLVGAIWMRWVGD